MQDLLASPRTKLFDLFDAREAAWSGIGCPHHLDGRGRTRALRCAHMKALYVSYDGMTDPLGQSQVIPYLAGLRERGHEFHLLSCEKPQRRALHGKNVARLLESLGISWVPLTYHKRPPLLSTIIDVQNLRFNAIQLHLAHRFQVVHARSYISSLAALTLKRRFGLPFLFDMRGFWADERVDGDLWDRSNPLYEGIYRYFKQREADFLRESDAIVVLTREAKAELLRWDLRGVSDEKISVIPCCTDLRHFCRAAVTEDARTVAARRLGISADDFVVVYLGSIGTWYLIDEMLAMFARLLRTRPTAKLLLVTPDDTTSIVTRATRMGIDASRLVVTHEQRRDVPAVLSLARVGLFFIKPTYSKKGSSPTKLGELLAMGLPVISNAGVGDSDRISAEFPIGPVVRDFTEAEYDRAAGELSEAVSVDPGKIRGIATQLFSLETGVATYATIYDRIAKGVQDLSSSADVGIQ